MNLKAWILDLNVCSDGDPTAFDLFEHFKQEFMRPA